ncbi:MAG: DNA primase [Gammaproteobacteria bacterium]
MSSEVPFNLQWEALGNEGAEVGTTLRARVFGGWLVRVGESLAFVADPEGRWDGEDFGEDDYEYEDEDEEEEDEEDEDADEEEEEA